MWPTIGRLITTVLAVLVLLAFGYRSSETLPASAQAPLAAPRAPEPLPATPDLCLVPYPRIVRLSPGDFAITKRLIVSVDGTASTYAAAEELKGDLAVCLPSCSPVSVTHALSANIWRLALCAANRDIHRLPMLVPPDQAESYALRVSSNGAVIAASSEIGMLHGISTLRQLFRANLHGGAIPCVDIVDWPALKYRGFLDDITRGPSPTLAQLKREASFASYLRMNCLTGYLEHQFAFSKHPEIGPKNGSLTPEDLKAFVQYGAQRGIEAIGCQQSFGHLGAILSHSQYAGLRETPDIISPTNEGSYRLLDDLYSEQAPLLQSKLFLVCCDETDGLGTGPSKSLVDQIGVGGVYARHIGRIHDLITGKYGKQMLMWGDIILQHPDHLREIPKDVIVLSWGYSAEPSFDRAILPFKQSGLEFIVCPGVTNWNRILPDFGTSEVNIHNFVRDGVKNGAIGMLNTTWNDDGETLFGPDWYGLAFGAECAWNGSATSVEQFNRRVGAVLFGEKSDHFGQAISLLGRTPALPNYQFMMDSRFWQFDDGRLPGTRETAISQARALLAVVQPAIIHLRQARREARFNGEVLDTYLFGAERMRFLASRQLDYLKAADAYNAAEGSPATAAASIAGAVSAVRGMRETLRGFRTEYVRLWQIEKRPYALDTVLSRYDSAFARYSRMLDSLAGAKVACAADKPLPTAESVGLTVVELGARSARPSQVLAIPMSSGSPWARPDQPSRMGVDIAAGTGDRIDQPIEVEMPGSFARGAGARLFELKDASQTSVPCQVVIESGRRRLVFIVAGRTAAGSHRDYLLYYGAPNNLAAPASTVYTTSEGCWIDNGRLRLLVGYEGAHIYRWDDRDFGGTNLTQPGGRDWEGFADIIGSSRNARNRIDVLETGPVRTRLRCTDTTGLVKTFDVWAGVPWVECTLNTSSGWFANYDDIAVMGADTKTPGRYLFQNGDTGSLHALSNKTDCQERRDGQRWSAKYVPGGAMVALITPEVACRHGVGPGGGMGAVFTEGSPEPSHFVIYGGRAPASPKQALEALRASLDFSNPPAITIFGVQNQRIIANRVSR